MKKQTSKVRRLQLTPRGADEPILCRLEMTDDSSISFEMDSKAAMTVMVALQAYQKRYHWPIPMKRVFRAKE